MIARRGNAMIRIGITFGCWIASVVSDGIHQVSSGFRYMGMMIRFIHVQHRWRMQVANRQREHCNQDQKRSGHRVRLTAGMVNCNQGKSGLTDTPRVAK